MIAAAVVVVALLGVGFGAFALLSDDDGGGTGTTAPTGATGAIRRMPRDRPHPSGSAGKPFTQLSEADLLGTFNLTFSPEGDTDAGSATNATWSSNCDERSGDHPCDSDAVAPPVSGFLKRLGKANSGRVTGTLPCGEGDMDGRIRDGQAIVDGNDVEGKGPVTEIRGEGTMVNGTCPGKVFTLVGTLT